MSLAATIYFWNKAVKTAAVKKAIESTRIKHSYRSTTANYAGVVYDVSTGEVRRSKESNGLPEVTATALLLTVDEVDFAKYLLSFQEDQFLAYHPMVGDGWKIQVSRRRQTTRGDWHRRRNYVWIHEVSYLKNSVYLRFFGDPVAFENDFAMFILGAD